MRRSLLLLAAGLALAGPFYVGYRLSASSRATAPVAIPSLVDQVREAISEHYYRPVPEKVLALHSVDEIISALGDPYTAYLAPTDYRLVRQETASTYSGIGISVLPSRQGLIVVALRRGPAERAGVQVGDTIVRVGGLAAAKLTMAQGLARILGPRGTMVRLTLTRAGRQPLHLRIRRELVHAPSVHARLLSYAGKRWGVVRLSQFRLGVAVVLAHELESLARQGAQGFVLDLRENPGGLLDQAVAVSSLFLDHGVVVSLKGAHERHEVFRALGGPVTRKPLVVVVDRYSASSSEIVAAALRDNHRAVIVGERTFGKAVVESFDPLGNGAALELTIARYTTPSGKDINGVGVTPQVRAVDNPRTPQDEALLAALRVLARPTS
jgi:carboxyl-terminal processing protease